MVAPVILVLLWSSAPLAGIAILALSHALLFYATLRPNVQWWGPVVTHFDTAKRQVWLTIDDGPTSDTRAMMDVLERHRAVATFFVKGTLAAADPELVREIIARGHGVANHSNTHPAGSFWCSPPQRIADEIDRCNKALADACGHPPRWFRAPVGMKNPAVHPALARRGMRLIGWTSRGFDGVKGDPDEVLARILKSVRPGAIVLLHQGRDYSLRVVERAVCGLEERGYSFVIPDDSQLRV